jgi:hypothetical protein
MSARELWDNGRHYHLEQPAHTVVASHKPIVKLIVRQWLPIVARTVRLVTQRETGKLRVQLRV